MNNKCRLQTVVMEDSNYNRTAILDSLRHTTHTDVGSAENARSNFQPTTMARIVPTILLHFLHPWRSDVGSAEIAYVHGRTVVGQCICPWMDGSRTTQEQLSRSSCRGAVAEEQISARPSLDIKKPAHVTHEQVY